MLRQEPKKTVNGYARRLKVHHSLISNTIAGRCNSRRVLRALLADGCPVELLGLPKDMRRAA